MFFTKFLKNILLIFLLVFFHSVPLKSEITLDIPGAFYNGGIFIRDGAVSIVTDDDKDIYLGVNSINISVDALDLTPLGDFRGDAGSGIYIFQSDPLDFNLTLGSISLPENDALGELSIVNELGLGFFDFDVTFAGTVTASNLFINHTTSDTTSFTVRFDDSVTFNSTATNNLIYTDRAIDMHVYFSGTTIDFGSSGLEIRDANTVPGIISYANIVFDGIGDQTISGTINTETAFNVGLFEMGKLSVTNTGGTVTFNDAIGAITPINEILLAANTNVVFKDEINAANITIDGGRVTMNKPGNEITSGGTLTIANGSTVNLGSGIAAGDTVFDATNAGSVAIGTMTLTAPSSFTSGSIIFVDSSTGDDISGVISGISIADTALLDYTLSVTDSNQDIILSVTSITAEESVSNLNLPSYGIPSKTQNSFTQAWAFLSEDSSIDEDAYTAFNSAIIAGGRTAANLAKQTAPQMDSVAGSNIVASSTASSVMNIASTRLASVRKDTLLANYTNNLSTTDSTMNLYGSDDQREVFFKSFGTNVKGNSYGSVDGYKADVVGFLVGTDHKQANGSRLGIAYGYSNSDVSGKGIGQSVTEIYSHHVMVYGDYLFNNNIFEGMIGFADGSNNTSRKINVSGLDRTALGEFNSRSLFARAAISTDLQNPFGNEVIRLSYGLSASQINNSSYTETGANSLNMAITPDDSETFVSFLGIKLNKKFQGEVLETKILEFRAGLSYDFIGDRSSTIASYTGDSTSLFSVDGNPVDQFGYSFGAGYILKDDDSKKWSLNYDVEAKSNSLSQTASLDINYRF